MPWTPVAIAVGVLGVVAFIAYLIFAAGSGSTGASAADSAAFDASAGIPGTWVPPQGRAHFPFAYTPNVTPIPFCVGAVGPPPAGIRVATPTPIVSPTATRTPTDASVATDCYASNPPSSGEHLNVQNNVDLGNGFILTHIPPDPDVYPDQVDIPREMIPHILEHAGVFVGWNCKSGDTACTDVVKEIKSVVNGRIDVNKNRVVMAHDPDLVEGTIGLSSWTRWEQFSYKDYKQGNLVAFISKNSCRVDWEGFCP